MKKEVTIVTPVKIIKSAVYALILKDAAGVHHYFDKDGEYDGYSIDLEDDRVELSDYVKGGCQVELINLFVELFSELQDNHILDGSSRAFFKKYLEKSLSINGFKVSNQDTRHFVLSPVKGRKYAQELIEISVGVAFGVYSWEHGYELSEALNLYAEKLRLGKYKVLVEGKEVRLLEIKK